jgi:hypothetical protein
MQKLIGFTLIIGAMALSLSAQAADGSGGPTRFSARLVSYQEVPAVSAASGGDITIVIDDAAQTIAYRLSYDGLEGAVRMAHIHIAQPGVNGGVMLWLCGTVGGFAGPAGTPKCPASGEVTGMLVPAGVQAVSAQGIPVGAFEEAVAAIREGVAYANVHSEAFPGGEIRGQLRPGGGHK